MHTPRFGYSAAECVTSNQSAAQLTSNNRNRARNGNFGTGDQGSKLPHLPERRPGSVRAETKNPANSGPFSTVSAKRQNSGLGGGVRSQIRTGLHPQIPN